MNLHHRVVEEFADWISEVDRKWLWELFSTENNGWMFCVWFFRDYPPDSRSLLLALFLQGQELWDLLAFLNDGSSLDKLQ